MESLVSEEIGEQVRALLNRIVTAIKTGGMEEIRMPGLTVYFEKRDSVLHIGAYLEVGEKEKPGKYKWTVQEVVLRDTVAIEGRNVNVSCFLNPTKNNTRWLVKVSDAFIMIVYVYDNLKAIWLKQL